ncbi:MAG TPA: DUF4384 domain-containing protein [Gemmatimonadales bacterium]|jgi:hypothetical protein
MLTTLLLLASHAQPLPAVAIETQANDPPVHVWYNSGGDYTTGDRAKVYAKTAQAGYLVVLRADVDGRVRVLFPLDPSDDQRITGDKKYELKGRGGREAFVADDTTGNGTVLAAYSKTPFRFDQFDKGGHWDTDALSGGGLKDVQADPESQLRGIVQRMQASGEHFDYDVATYTVAPVPRYVRSMSPWPYYGYGYYGWPGWGYGFGPRFGFGFDRVIVVRPRR